MPFNPQTLHDQDWLETKASDVFFEQAPRYLDIADVIARLHPRRLLDVGCGSGYLAKLLKGHMPRLVVHGVDISSVALERARAHVDQVWQGDLDKADLPVSSEQYDTVTCIEVLEHLYDPDHALREIARVIGPGGRAVVTVPNLGRTGAIASTSSGDACHRPQWTGATSISLTTGSLPRPWPGRVSSLWE